MDFLSILLLLASACTSYSSEIRWISRKDVQNEPLESAGFVRSFPHPFHPNVPYTLHHVARASHSGGVIPAVVTTSVGSSDEFSGRVPLLRNDANERMYFSYKGKQYSKGGMDYDLLVYPPGALVWVQVVNQTVIQDVTLFPVGKDPEFETPFYVCRAWNQFDLLLGYLQSNGTGCIVHNYPSLHGNAEYDVLVYFHREKNEIKTDVSNSFPNLTGRALPTNAFMSWS